MDHIDISARAKINLSLDVTGRRDNGYHDVRMIMQSLELHDDITIYRTGSHTKEIIIETDGADLPADEDNLIYKAARLIMDETGIVEGVRIACRKNIPIAAGMAGGSTDAAAVFNGINELFSLGLGKDSLKEMGVRIGADVPYCIMGGTALSEGIGEILTPLPPMPECTILIAKPDAGVSTAFVYKEFDSLEDKIHPDVDSMADAIRDQDIRRISELLGNSLEGVTIREHPVIDKIKQTMLGNGALGSLMSGSGPTVFGIFDDRDKAVLASDILKKDTEVKDVIITGPYNI